MTTFAPTKLITWSEQYSVGIARIDLEHQKLIDLINDLHAAMLAGKGRTVMGKILDGVASYTVSHFANEEGLMRRHGYPGYEAHKAEHLKLVEQVKRIQDDFRAEKAVISQDVMTFLQHWLLCHIAGVDKKYTSHLLAAGVT